jgi:hypothetical protein
MSYFKQITRRYRPMHGGRSQSLPLLHPPDLLFSPEAVNQPLEIPNNMLGSTWHEVLDVPSPPSFVSRAEEISSVASRALPPTSQDLLSPVLEPPTTKESGIQRNQDSSVKSTLTSLKESFATNPETQPSPSPLPSSVPPSSKVFKAAPGEQVLQGQIEPVTPYRFSSSSHPQLSDSVDPQPAVKAPKAPISQAIVSAPEGKLSRIEPATQPLHTILEPLSSTRRQPAEEIKALGPTQLTQVLQMPGNPGTTSSQKPSIHIGTIDIQITPSPETPKPVVRRSPKSGSGQLSRGFASSFGLRQG